MTEDEIEEMKAALKSAQDSIKALEATNKSLKSEKTEASRAAKAAQEAADEAAREAAEKSGDVETVKASLTKLHAQELKKLQDANKAVTTKLQKLTVDDAISRAIAEAGVLPHMVEFAELKLKKGVEFSDTGEATVDGVPFADHIATSIKSDAFAPLIAAAVNSGAGARGSTTPGKAPLDSLDAIMAARLADPNALNSANVAPEFAGVQRALTP